MPDLVKKTITDKIRYQDNDKPQDYAVRATLTGWDGTPTDVADAFSGLVIPREFSGSINAQGEFTIDLWPNSRGTRGSQYQFQIVDSEGENIINARITVPEAESEPIILRDILPSDPLPSVSAAAQAEINAQQHALDALDHRNAAEESADLAEAAKTAAIPAAEIFATVADGLAGTVDGDYFTVVDGNRVILYRNDTGTANQIQVVYVKHTLDAITAPTAGDDETQGYDPGSVWFDQSEGESYKCLDATEANAVWVNTSLTLEDLGGAALKDVATAAEHDSPAGVDKVPTLAKMTEATDRAYSRAVATAAEHDAPAGVDKVPTLKRMASATDRAYSRAARGAGPLLAEEDLAVNGGTIPEENRVNTFSMVQYFSSGLRIARETLADFQFRINSADHLEVRTDTSGNRITLSGDGNGGTFGGGSTAFRGAGAWDAEVLYENGNRVVTDYVFDAALDGSIDYATYDAFMGEKEVQIDEGEEEVEEEVEVTEPVETYKDEWDDERQGYVRRLVTIERPVQTDYPVYDEQGNQIGSRKGTKKEDSKHKRRKRRTEMQPQTHEPARAFEFDELDPAVFSAKCRATRKLPAMQRAEDRCVNGNPPSIGNTMQALLETCEVQAVHIEKLEARIQALEEAQS